MRQGRKAETERPKPKGWINNNHKAEYSDKMAELKENHKAKFYHTAELKIYKTTIYIINTS